jgi:hypothetical protein
VRVDLHLHSRYSHDGQDSLNELIERCHDCGLDRIVLTDHHTVEGALELARIPPELAIVGEEVKTREGEVIGLFITEGLPHFARPEDVMDLVHEMGAHMCRIRSTGTARISELSASSSWRLASTSSMSATRGARQKPIRWRRWLKI